MFYRREEGEMLRCGFNLTKTKTGHGVRLMVCLPQSYKIMVGYYWGLKFNLDFDAWNQNKVNEIMRRM